MKTILPAAITTVEEAKAFLTDLHNNNETFHPEDDAHGIIWATTDEPPTAEECDRLNKLMDDIYDLPGNDGKHDNSIAFCPCGFLISLDPQQDKDLLYIIDLNERGEFAAHVEDSDGHVIWEIQTEEARQLVEDGFVKDLLDAAQIKRYLREDVQIIDEDDDVKFTGSKS